ncbi:MAG: HAD family acid phosphatase [Woeseiaceae bacterium]|nr:HAD family acid phosphatase [Woeseiaceae bacterium]
MHTIKHLALLVATTLVAACASTPEPAEEAFTPWGLLWVENAAEYRALALQAYGTATRDLPRFVEDTSWSALPTQTDAADLPPAVILDVDETVVSNVDFQMNFEPPFSNRKHDDWNAANVSIEIPGVADFVDAAREAGVTVFFVTNRPCEPAGQFPCTQRQTTIGDINEVGIEVDAEHVLLADERGWTSEKSTRRAHIARTHRVIMLFGDDLGDFLTCVRKTIHDPCEVSASAASREQAILEHHEFWGAGWYILPNPMYGSWTSHR